MTSPLRAPTHVPTVTEVVSWSSAAKPTEWTPPQPVPVDLSREVEARVMHQLQQLLPTLVAQALQEALEARSSDSSAN